MRNVLFPRFSDGRLWSKIAIGTLLMFLPVVNILAFGYLYRFAKDPHYASDGGVQLPEWDRPLSLLVDGLRLICFIVCHLLFAGLLANLTVWTLCFGSLGHVRLHWIFFMPLAVALTLPLFLTCLLLYFQREWVPDCLHILSLDHYIRRFWWPMIWPAMGFVGLQCTCQWILYGAAWFLGYGVVFASFNELLRHFGDRILGPTYPQLPLRS
ncbi:MAG: DUF4013 domain-containing protein [Puniceicoccales bacterium]|jgi:hypothetical protein|nr:DUF4013 domain-containing protein [Puniceicoccales bacterium]